MSEIMEMRRQRASLAKEAEAVLSAADEEDRGLTDEEQEKVDELMEKVQELHERETVAVQRQGLTEHMRDLGTAEPTLPNPENNQSDGRESRFEGLGQFLQAVARAYQPGGQVDPRIAELRQQGLNEGVPAEGGFLVQQDFVQQLIQRVYEIGILSNRVRRIPISANANGLVMNGINETSRQSGSRYGGVQGYWLAEAGTKTPSQPEFRQIQLRLNKLIGACWATDELLEDAAALGAVIEQAFAEEFAFMVDEAILRGTGAGQPLGVLNSPALITQAAEAGQTANTIVYENVLNMWSRMWARSRANAVWLVDQSVEPQLYTMSLAVGTGGVPVYMPAGGASGVPYSTLFGRPVIAIEQASALGNTGDISLVDLSQYLMIDKGGMQSASSIHVSFLTDEQVFRFVYRMDGQPIWNSPLTPASGGNTLSPFITLADRL